MTRPGFALSAYLAASRAIPLVAPRHLQARLDRGKELPDRWREKLGQPTASRPEGSLIWLHAVGLGETLALRGLIAALSVPTGEGGLYEVDMQLRPTGSKGPVAVSMRAFLSCVAAGR